SEANSAIASSRHGAAVPAGVTPVHNKLFAARSPFSRAAGGLPRERSRGRAVGAERVGADVIHCRGLTPLASARPDKEGGSPHNHDGRGELARAVAGFGLGALKR